MNIDDLVVELKSLSEEELRKKLEDIRANRRQKVERKVSEKKVVSVKPRKKEEDDLFSDLGDDLFS
jgi:hypothetical protein